jgi:predicted transcriptional regulator YdeE
MAISDLFKRLFNKEENIDNKVKEKVESNIVYEIDEEDKIVVALAAAAMAGQDKPNSKFHISKITRVK